jgi:tetratricopeptide (TPR) repeat protein
MFKSDDARLTRLEKTQADLIERDLPKFRMGLPGVAWAGLSLFIILLTIFLLLLMDGRSVVHAAEKERSWSAAMLAGDWAQVQKMAKAAVDKNPRDAEAQNALGMAMTELGQFEQAEIPLITAESLAPGIADYKIDLGELYSRRGVDGYSQAAAKFREALDLDPSLVNIHWRLARVLYVLKDYEGSIAELRIINQLEPENWDAYRLTADVAMGLATRLSGDEKAAKYNEAIQNLKLYTSVVPDARAYAKLAFAYMSLTPPDTSSARAAARTALTIDPGDSQAHLALARIVLVQLSQKGLPAATTNALMSEALGQYTEAASFYLPARDAYYVSRLAGRDAARAEVALRTAAAIDTTNKDYAFELASNLMTQQKYDEARSIYRRVVDLDPGNVSAWVNLGMAEKQAGDPDEALKIYEKAMAIDQTYPAVHKAMGDVLKDKGRTSEAIDSYRRAVEMAKQKSDRKTCAEAGDALGYTLYEQGDYGGSAQALEGALTCDECATHALLTLASAYQKMNQTDKVCATMRRALTCPSDPEIRKAAAAYGCK